MNRSNHALACCSDAGGCGAASADGVIRFTLSRRPSGLHVERVQVRPGPARVVQSMTFGDEASFTSWCDADALRFNYPLIYSHVRRDGQALFDEA